MFKFVICVNVTPLLLASYFLQIFTLLDVFFSDSPQPVKDAYSGSYSPQPHSNTPPPESNSAFIQQSTDYHHIHPGLPPPPGLEPVTLPTSNQPPPPGTEVEGPLLPPHLQQVLQEELLEEEKPPRFVIRKCSRHDIAAKLLTWRLNNNHSLCNNYSVYLLLNEILMGYNSMFV
jgi:hypothetical protein